MLNNARIGTVEPSAESKILKSKRLQPDERVLARKYASKRKTYQTRETGHVLKKSPVSHACHSCSLKFPSAYKKHQHDRVEHAGAQDGFRESGGRPAYSPRREFEADSSEVSRLLVTSAGMHRCSVYEALDCTNGAQPRIVNKAHLVPRNCHRSLMRRPQNASSRRHQRREMSRRGREDVLAPRMIQSSLHQVYQKAHNEALFSADCEISRAGQAVLLINQIRII